MVSKHFLCALPYPWKVNNEKKNGRLYRLSIPFWKVRKRKKKQSIEHSGKLLLTVWKFWKRRSLNFFSSLKLIYLSHYCRMRSCLPESHLSKCSGDRYQQYFLRKNQVRITFCFVLFKHSSAMKRNWWDPPPTSLLIPAGWASSTSKFYLVSERDESSTPRYLT